MANTVVCIFPHSRASLKPLTLKLLLQYDTTSRYWRPCRTEPVEIPWSSTCPPGGGSSRYSWVDGVWWHWRPMQRSPANSTTSAVPDYMHTAPHRLIFRPHFDENCLFRDPFRWDLDIFDDARNNVRCTQARKATHGLDGQHQDVDRTLRGRVNQNDRGLQRQMEKVRPWCGQPSDRGRLKEQNSSHEELQPASSRCRHSKVRLIKLLITSNESELSSWRTLASVCGAYCFANSTAYSLAVCLHSRIYILPT